MKAEINLRLSGEAGQGVETLGLILCRVLKQSHLHFFAVQDYMSRIRGGNNFLQFRLAAQPVAASRDAVDLLVALDRASVGLHEKAVGRQGVILCEGNGDNADGRILSLPFTEMARTSGGATLYTNIVALGAVASLLGLSLEAVDAELNRAFGAKGGDVVAKNRAAAKAGYEAAGDRRGVLALPAGRSIGRRYFINGNEAIALGALASGVQFYSAYPMTPSTGVLNTIAAYARRFRVAVEQAEDEIAAINMAIGASFAGARAMTGSSGGGFALMVEGVSLAGMTETPVVILVAMRPGPATGFPTRTEQGDLNFVLHAGHGEFARAVFSPGTVAECHDCTIRAFDLAGRLQIPAFILTDQYLADSLIDSPPFKTGPVSPVKDVIDPEAMDDPAAYRRYALGAGPVSPRALPGLFPGVVCADSDEHTEEGHITEDAETRRRMTDKRFLKKEKLLESKSMAPVVRGPKNPKRVFIGFGSTAPVLAEAREKLADPGTAVIHLPQVWPLPRRRLAVLLEKIKSVYTVEHNAGAQLAGLLRREIGVKVTGSILRYDGRPFTLDGLVREMKKRS